MYAAPILVVLLAGAFAMAAQPSVSVTAVRQLPAQRGNQHYVTHRAPLKPDPLVKLPIGAIHPHGWLRHQLEAMRHGMVGHLPEISKWCNPKTSSWLTPDGSGENGWEEFPYWFKGYCDLGFVLEDRALIAKTKQWVDRILASQRSDGYFGPQANRDKNDLWPNMIVLNVLQSYYEATNDERVLGFLTRYFHWQGTIPDEQLLPGSWQKLRGGDNLESILWLYNRTGDKTLLDVAHKVHRSTARWDQEVESWHGVNICQGYREPATYWVLSHDEKDLAASERNYQEVMGKYGQVPGGMFGADENARQGYHGPRQAAETCSMVEFMHSFQLLMRFTGDPVHADRCEDVAFNSLPAAAMPDYRGLHYLTAPNMVQLDRENKAPGIQNGGCMLAFSPHRYRCCQHNVAMGWPYFAEHLWLATQDNGLAAMLYAPCEVTARVANGKEIRLVQRTDYPFGESVHITVETDSAVWFPLYLRVPDWAQGVVVRFANGNETRIEPGARFVRVEREWIGGERLTVTFGTRIELRHWPTNNSTTSVRRGPLWYSLKIAERWERAGGTDEWPAFEVFPDSPWNYGLVLTDDRPQDAFTVKRRSGPLAPQPFTVAGAPIEIRAKAKRIPEWKLDFFGLIDEVQPGPAHTTAPIEDVTLIPMGCARLRVSAFPRASDERSAKRWRPPPKLMHKASYYCDDIKALSDGKLPQNSGDHAIPRFTWWPKRGSTEWVTYQFEAPREVSWCEVYWFDDTGFGHCRVPQRWILYYHDDGAWWEVPVADTFGVQADQFNRVQFEPVKTTQLKIEVQLKDQMSGGILEWRVGGAEDA